MVCVTCVLIEQLVPARPPKKLKWPQTSPNGDGLPPVVLRGCFAAKNIFKQRYLKDASAELCVYNGQGEEQNDGYET